MALGISVDLPVAYGGALPFCKSDAILSNGSLVLHDFTHSTEPLSGVPGNGTVIPNIATKEALALTGDACAGNMIFANVTASNFKMERSSKGGIHGIANISGGTGAVYANIEMHTNVRNYLVANSTHDYYVSMWGRVTKAATSTSAAGAVLVLIGASISEYFAYMDYASNRQPGSQGLGSDVVPAVNTLGNFFRALAQDGYYGASPSAGYRKMCAWGASFSGAGFSGLDKAPSHIIYRAYLEDLTVSGRTYAQVMALDKALYDRAFATGGRFAGDTFTDPASVVWS